MIVHVGGVRGPLSAPYIYAIRTRDLIYVGETQGHPVVRWGGHLQLEGSFRRAVRSQGDPEVDYLRDIAFFGFYCQRLAEEFPLTSRKLATQALEHQLHTEIACRPSVLGAGLRLISDTEKTAPRRFEAWKTVEALADALLNALKEAILAGHPWVEGHL